jgi:hypothetical protein
MQEVCVGQVSQDSCESIIKMENVVGAQEVRWDGGIPIQEANINFYIKLLVFSLGNLSKDTV